MHEIAAGFLVDADGRVLLGFRAGWKALWPGHWDCIGGHIEAGENAETALRREVREEVGVVPMSCAPLADIAAGDVHLRLYLIRQWSGGAPANCSAEHEAVRWFTLAELRDLTPIVPFGYAELLAPYLQ